MPWLAMHQLELKDGGEVTVGGYAVGVIMVGGADSGFDVGLTTGSVEAKGAGMMMGTVVIGFVMSFWPEGEEGWYFFTWATSLAYPTASFLVTIHPEPEAERRKRWHSRIIA